MTDRPDKQGVELLSAFDPAVVVRFFGSRVSDVPIVTRGGKLAL